ncbi:MAG: class I tRNA ligase family protein [Candidatus Thermoplasmatota archaeon]|nr:class I tRNA ligase family protein [Candidatus Thermoplasmatota archaeon]
MEDQIKDFWDSEDIHKKSVGLRRGSRNLYLARPPITAKDSPNWDELYSITVYDVWARFKSMQNFHVRNGIGLDPLCFAPEKISLKDQDINCSRPISDENASEILLGIEDRSDGFMEDMFEELLDLGVWTGSEFDYKTTLGGFVDSVWWSVKELMDKGMLVEKEKPVKWCPHCKISPAVSEISSKKEMRDKIFVKVPLTSSKKRYFLLDIDDIWMFPAGLNIAVNPDFKYAVVKTDLGEEDPDQLVMLKKKVEDIMEEGGIDEYEISNTVNGEQLGGLSFRYPLEDKIPEKTDLEDTNTRKVILSEKVPNEGTGVIFIVPEFRDKDRKIAEEKDLGSYNPIFKNGYFDGGARKNKYSGLSTFESESVIIDDLESKDLLFSKKKIEVDAEVCDVCKTRLIRYPIKEWFFEISQMGDEFQKKLEELEVLPSHEYIRLNDLPISRENIWGIPFPRWECSCGRTFLPSARSDLAEISDYEVNETLSIDEIRNSKANCPECGNKMNWEKKTLNPLFIQACSPWAQLDHPSKEKTIKSWWPSKVLLGKKSDDANLVTANLTLSMSLFAEASAEKIMFLGPVSSEIEYKEVKSLVSKRGYDSLRLHLLSDGALWDRKEITSEELEFPHPVVKVAWNLSKFFEDNLDNLEIDIEKISSASLEDNIPLEEKWILSRMESAKKDVLKYYEQCRPDEVIEILNDLILKDIAQSYIKLARTKLEEGDKKEKKSVMKIIYLILDDLSKLLSPISPFVAEDIYQSLGRDKESVFMEDWPESDDRYVDETLEDMMDDVRTIVDEIIHVKRKAELPEKWPLDNIVYNAKNQRGVDLVEKFNTYIKHKARVKNMQILGPDETWEEAVFKARPNKEVIAKSYQHWVRKIATLLKQKSPENIKEGIEKGGFEMGIEGQIVEIGPDMVSFEREIPEGFEEISLDDQDIFVDLKVTEEIWEEEMVKEITLRLKSMRRDLDLRGEDEIEIYLYAGEEATEAVEKQKSEIEEEVGAREIQVDEAEMEGAQYILEWDVNGESVEIGIKPLYKTRIIDYYSNIPGLDMATAERLYESGYTSIDSIIDADLSDLSQIKGIENELAKSILDQIEEDEIESILEETKEEGTAREEREGPKREAVEADEDYEEGYEAEKIRKELPEGVSKSYTYLIEEKTSDRSFKLFREILENEDTGLCVTRDYPDKIRKKYELEDVEMIWLSNVDREDVIRPKSLEKLSLALENFLARQGDVILLKGVEYLISNNDFKTVLHLVQSIKDQVAVNEAILMIPINPSVLEKHQMDQISGVVDGTIKKEG